MSDTWITLSVTGRTVFNFVFRCSALMFFKALLPFLPEDQALLVVPGSLGAQKVPWKEKHSR